ncbi:glycoside hydrolase family 44 [Niastella vici]|uniref:Glycoside hydrolase family 44 n=1 Tax=Niastella vici TaxID=1703345 RepID=A0A1V9FZG2_9BACT|nr:glycoside hydrolase family 44 protein [Niastella vici]OQP63722.1 glycoside hydrolase family 44 [Niastella vici]
MKQFSLTSLLLCLYIALNAQNVQVSVKIFNNRKAVSPYIYGRNNSITDFVGNPVSASNWQLYKDAGLNFFRENGGNNLTKHNWRLNISSHPDWYNNVYTSNWDYAAQTLLQNIPAAQGMWGFQLVGKAASTNANNFNDWAYNNSQWWSGVNQNLAGGGVINTAGGSQALVNGDPSLYLQNWNEDSTTGILNHWFGNGGLGLDSTKIRYWNMDNEPEIWSGTHDDIMPVQPSAEAFMQSYFAVAKKARALFPGIKLTGPVSPNEWQWFNWGAAPVTGSDGKRYPWLQYFIKRVAEEEQSTGIRLLDVIDLHFYPSSTSPSDVVQYHRVFFDSTYIYPEANGVHVVNGGWDNTIQIENVFGRCQKWLNQYMGPNNGVTFAVSETATQLQNNPNAVAVWYASMLGEFMNHGVEYFTPWNWETGMWETLHLFSRYNKTNSVKATSSDETNVSAYTTVNNNNDSVTIALVNRSQSLSKTVVINFSDFLAANQAAKTLTLSNLPVGTETFLSHSSNALQTATISPQNNTLQVTLAPMSITSVIVTGAAAILPQNLLSFTASKGDNKVILNFTTTNQLNLASFDVERSADGSSFTTIGTVTGEGANGQYAFIDAQPLPSINYYRLKLIDHTGGYSYSKILPVRYDKNAAITVFPNPAKEVLTVQLHLPAGAISLQIIDGMGRMMKTMLLQSSGSTLSTTIDLSGLAAGQYYIHAGSEIISFVIQK